MIGSERHEFEPTPRWQGVELVTVRPNPDQVAAQLRQALPVSLGEVLAEVPDATLRLTLMTDADGMVAVTLAVDARADTAALAAAVDGIVQPFAETEAAVSDDPLPDLAEWWPVIAERFSGTIGFSAGCDDRKGSTLVPVNDGTVTTQLVEDLATLPGHGLCVELRSRGESAQPTWEAQMWVLTAGEAPSLRMRSAVRRRFPDLQIATDPTVDPVRVHLEASSLPAVLPVPVAGATPLAGTYPGPAAPIPVAPDRRSAEPGLLIGQAVTGGGRPIPVELTEAERLRHVHVLGQTGTGKSSALAGMVAGLAARGDGALIADPHGQLCDRILAELPAEARDRVWLIRCGDVDNPVPLNPLAESDPVRRDIAIQEICAAFQYLFDKQQTGIVGPRFLDHVGMTLRALAAVHGTRASLLDVPIACADERFMAHAVARADDERLKTWWRTFELSKRSNEHGELLAWVNSKFGPLSGTVAMRAILGSGADAVDFADAMDEGRIILLDLSKATLGEQASRLLGYLYLSRVWEAALRRRRPERTFTVMVDEAHTLIAGALTNMLAEGRKFGLSVVLAHQYLDQLDEDLRPAVNGNVATTIAFRCAAGDASDLARRLGGAADPSTLVTLPDLTAIVLRSAAAGPAFPHTLVIDYNDRATPRVGLDLIEQEGHVLGATYRDLVSPHRELTSTAAAGTSNVAAIPVDLSSRPAPPKPGPAPKPATDSAPVPKAGGSFLDEWLAKRQATAAAAKTKDAACPAGQQDSPDASTPVDDKSADDATTDGVLAG
jgi:hypothetical protein